MPTTSNFGWTTPADTDLVKDGAAAIRTLGNGIDTSLVDLKGGTTGQVLSKASNTDLDFTWTAGGDITEVQAGTGISVASGTGPVPVVTNTVATAFDAKGDLIGGTGADTFAKLTVGANDTVLTADSSTATGLKWAAPAGGGKVLQVVQASTATAVTFSSTTYTDTGLSGTITPTSSSSKILVLVNQQVYILATSGGTLTGSIQLLRGSTVVYEPQSNEQLFGLSNAPAGRYDLQTMVPLTYLDSPATTSATTYKLQGALLLTSGGNQLNFQQDNTGRSVITLLEIGA